MVQTHFPLLPESTLAAINTVGQWLAQDDLGDTRDVAAVDRVILAGNAVMPTIDAACRLAAEHDVPLLISGGLAIRPRFCMRPSLSIRVITLSR